MTRSPKKDKKSKHDPTAGTAGHFKGSADHDMWSDDDDDTGGPSYANVPKGAKTSKQAKAMKARKKWMGSSDKIAKDLGYRHTAELVRDGDPDEIGEFMDTVDDVGQNWDGINYYNDLIRDHEMGVTPQDDDVIESSII